VALTGYLDSELVRLVATVEGVGEAAALARAAAVPIRAALERVPPILADAITDRVQIDAHRDQLAAPPRTRSGRWPRRWTRTSRGRPSSTRRKGAPSSPCGSAGSLLVPRDVPRDAERLGRGRRQTSGWCSHFGASRWSSAMLAISCCATATASCSNRFLDLLESWGGKALENTPQRIHKLREDCRRFGGILDRALENVNKRSELQKIPLDEQAVREALARRLSPCKHDRDISVAFCRYPQRRCPTAGQTSLRGPP